MLRIPTTSSRIPTNSALPAPLMCAPFISAALSYSCALSRICVYMHSYAHEDLTSAVTKNRRVLPGRLSRRGALARVRRIVGAQPGLDEARADQRELSSPIMPRRPGWAAPHRDLPRGAGIL